MPMDIYSFNKRNCFWKAETEKHPESTLWLTPQIPTTAGATSLRLETGTPPRSPMAGARIQLREPLLLLLSRKVCFQGSEFGSRYCTPALWYGTKVSLCDKLNPSPPQHLFFLMTNKEDFLFHFYIANTRQGTDEVAYQANPLPIPLASSMGDNVPAALPPI